MEERIKLDLQHRKTLKTTDKLKLDIGYPATVDVSWNDAYIDKAITQTPGLNVDDIIDTLGYTIRLEIEMEFEFDADEIAYFGGDESAAIMSKFYDDRTFELDVKDFQLRIQSVWGLNGSARAYGRLAAKLMRGSIEARLEVL